MTDILLQYFKMNNPFASGRDIFSNIQRPKPREPAQNQTTNPSSTDLNFRSEFRANKAPQQAPQPQYSVNTYKSVSNNYKQPEQANPKKPYAQFKQQQPNKTDSMNKVHKKFEQLDPQISVKHQDERTHEKLTFGNPLSSEDANKNAKFQLNDFKYDRKMYQNDFSSDASSFQHSQSNFSYKASSNIKKNEFKGESEPYNNATRGRQGIHHQRYYSSQSGFNEDKSIKSIGMSPIAEHSAHKFDNQGQMSDFLNLDNLGADIDKLLANSKNHEELCRLIGLQDHQKTTNKMTSGNIYGQSSNYHQKQQLGSNHKGNQYGVSSKQSQFQYSKNPGLYSNSRKQIYEESAHHPPLENRKKYEEQEQRASYNSRQVNQRQQNVSNIKTGPQWTQQSGLMKQQMNQNKITWNQQMVQMNQSKTDNNSIDNTPEQIFEYGSQPYENLKSNPQKSTGIDLEGIIDREMKKIYWNGKNRIFLSASDKIEAVKYDLQYI